MFILCTIVYFSYTNIILQLLLCLYYMLVYKYIFIGVIKCTLILVITLEITMVASTRYKQNILPLQCFNYKCLLSFSPQPKVGVQHDDLLRLLKVFTVCKSLFNDINDLGSRFSLDSVSPSICCCSQRLSDVTNDQSSSVSPFTDEFHEAIQSHDSFLGIFYGIVSPYFLYFHTVDHCIYSGYIIVRL